MPRSNVIRYGVIPALITIPLTALRAWLEVNHPGEMITKLVSLNVLALIWIIYVAVRMRRSGARIGAYLAVVAVFAVIYRVAISAVYTLAWAQNWKTAGGTPTRYQREMIDSFAQMKIEAPEQASAGLVFAATSFFPIVMHVVVGTIIWFVVKLFVKPSGSSSRSYSPAPPRG
jgi:hypothetical protein